MVPNVVFAFVLRALLRVCNKSLSMFYILSEKANMCILEKFSHTKDMRFAILVELLNFSIKDLEAFS